ncbi:MAG: hypothetical protein GXO82_07145, partial [Chlorobi bacterium]|nr:hypothetical protein [Chlorobiota bacterium]
SSELYIGSSGFLFDLAFEESIDVGVIEGGIRYETMVWWKVGVSWGAYASVKAWGEVLWGLVGAEIGLEGAFIGQPEYIVFAAGHLKVTVVWVISWEGRVWVAVGKVGFDGGTGKNSKYDDIIADARNTGKQMKSEMDKLAKDLEKARAAMYTLNDKQRAAAGQALITLSGGGNFATALVGLAIKKLYDEDRKIGNKSNHPYLNKVFDLIWDNKAVQLEARRQQLEKDKQKLAAALKDLDTETKNVQKRLQDKKNVLEGELPTLSSLGKYGNPVGSPQYKTVTVNGKTKTVKVGYAFDQNKAKKLTTGMKKEKTDYLKYRQQLLSLAKKFVNNLKEIDGLLYGKNNSVSHLVGNFTAVYQQSSAYSIHLWDYFNARQQWAGKKAALLMGWKSNIDDDLRRISFTEHWWKVLAFKRNLVVNTLKKAGGIKQLPKIDTSKQYANWDSIVVNLGREMWYHIPKAGFYVTAKNMALARQQYLQTYQYNQNVLQAKWSLFTMTSDKVYNRKVKLYTLLYDLMDQLSLEAGTRKLQPAPSDNVIVGTLVAFNIPSGKSPQVSGLSSTGNGGTILKGNVAQGNFSKVSQKNNPKVQNQSSKPEQYKATWAKGWNFENARKHIKKLLQVPKITQFTGTMRSNPNTIGYATLSLQWKASHPVAIAEYSFDIPGYSQPVKLSHIFPPSPTPQKKQTSQQQSGQAKLAEQQKGLLGQQFGSSQFGKLVSKKEIGRKASQIGTSATYGTAKIFSGSSYTWRSLDNYTKLLVPFFYGVHKAGKYDVWIRVRGAGGISLERKATVTIDYAYAVTKEDSAKGRDVGSPTKQSSLDISDTTPPTIPSVDDGGPLTSSSTLIYAKWSAVDYESGIQEYQYRVVNRSSKFTYTVQPWVSAGGQTEMNIRLDTPMKPGVVYYVEVKARNGAGMWSKIGSSNGIRLKDPTPPSKPIFIAVLLADTLEASWKASSDPESGILGYRYALGSTSGKDDVIPWTASSTTSIHLGKAHLKAVSKKAIVKGKTYYLSVRAVNGINVASQIATMPVVAK